MLGALGGLICSGVYKVRQGLFKSHPAPVAEWPVMLLVSLIARFERMLLLPVFQERNLSVNSLHLHSAPQQGGPSGGPHPSMSIITRCTFSAASPTKHLSHFPAVGFLLSTCLQRHSSYFTYLSFLIFVPSWTINSTRAGIFMSSSLHIPGLTVPGK